MSLTVGMISCQNTQVFPYDHPEKDRPTADEIRQIVMSATQKNTVLLPDLIHIIPGSNLNFYGGVKVIIGCDIKHDYYPWPNYDLIYQFEDLMNALPFSEAVLYHEGSSWLIQWEQTSTIESWEPDEECAKWEKCPRYPHISRCVLGRIDSLPSLNQEFNKLDYKLREQ